MTRSSDNPKSLPPFATMRAFEAVGRLCGVRRAAQALKLDHAVVSRHVRTLEEWAGVRLIHRVDGKTVLTEEGARYHARISTALAELNDASNELLLRNDESSLSICCVPGFAFEWLIPRLGAFQAANPNVKLELHATDEGPDFSRYEANVDIRYVPGDQPATRTSVSGVRSFEISRPPVFAVASPECAARLSYVSTPASLLDAPLLHEENESQWHLWFSEHGVATNDLALSGPRLWHAHMTLQAARRGQGVALANPFLLGDDLNAGRLVRLPADYDREVTLGSYVFLARADQWQTPAVVRFRLWLKDAAIISHLGRATLALRATREPTAIAV
ncbi:LysR substrate-binding domain-containing protein [Steroidobacter cummioxidans]|uniref:LysR substrate-binding domain-containing protein n=1 Tax=Steroidobacter cummioxidans TaxID=1803913 RepID=UPI000E318712|nr:LysR substrate-binding domain-containing protein [Steroidobacter cummioxidans]